MSNKGSWRVGECENTVTTRWNSDIWDLDTENGDEIEICVDEEGRGFYLCVNDKGAVFTKKELKEFVLAADAFIAGEKGDHED